MGWKGSLVEVPIWLIGLFNRSRFDPRHDTPREILVLRPNDFGDLLTATPIFEALRKRFPTTRLIAGVGSWGRPILENNPYVDEIVEIDAPWNNKVIKDQSLRNVARYLWRSPQVAALRQRGGLDIGIDVLGSHVGSLLMMRVGVRHRIGVRGYRGGWSACQSHINFAIRHCGRAALAQAELLGATVLPEVRPQLYLTDDERARARTIWQAGATPGRRTVRLLIGVAAGLPDKTWHARSLGTALADIARAVADTGDACDIAIVGSAADEARTAEVIEAAGPGVPIRSLAGQVPLRITFALAEQASVVLTNPSMLLHAAAAFRRPTVAILGGYFADSIGHDIVWGYPPPYRSVGPLECIAGKGELNWPSVERVVDAVVQSIAELTPAPEDAAGKLVDKAA